MRTRMRNQFPRRREIHVDDVVDARARSLVTVTDADARARATIVVDANSPRVVARRRHGGVEWNPSSRARADARDRRPRARVLESLLDESRDESRAGRDTRRDRPPIAVGKGKNTRGGLVDGSRPVEVVLVPPVAETASAWDGRSRARADVIDEGVVEGS